MSLKRGTDAKRKQLYTITEVPCLQQLSELHSKRDNRRRGSLQPPSNLQDGREPLQSRGKRRSSITSQTAHYSRDRRTNTPLNVGGWTPHDALAQRRDSRRLSHQLTEEDIKHLIAHAWKSHRQGEPSEEETSETTQASEDRRAMMREKFVMAARVVRRLCQVSMCMRKYAEDHIGKAFEFESKQRYRVPQKEGDAGGDQELTFDLDYFKMDSEYMFPEEAKRAAEKRPENRTPADLRLIGAVLRSLSSFRKYPRNIQDMLCRVVRYQSLGVNRVVIKKGHPGTAFYMVFSGRVGVVTTDDPDELMQRASMVVLRKGAVFGERAMITGAVRKATVRTLEQAELVVVDLFNLQDSDMLALYKQDFNNKFDFFRKLDLFSQWDDESVKQLASMARTQQCAHGTVVVRDMAAEPTVGFVTRGKCDIVKLLDLSDASSQIHQDVSTEPSSSTSRLRERSTAPKSFTALEESPPPASFPPLRPQTVPRSDRRTLQDVGHKKVARSKSATVGGTSKGGRHNSASVRYNSAEVRHKSASGRRNSADIRPLLSFSDIPMPSLENEEDSGADIDERSRARAQRKYSRRISHCAQRVGTFMTLGKLGPGRAFGLSHVCACPIPPHLSLVSRGASILHVTLRDFRAVSEGQPPLEGLEKENLEVPANRDLCERFFEESQWASYKRRVVEQAMVDIHRPKDGLGLRNYDVIETYPTSEDTLVIDVPGSDMPYQQRPTGGVLRQRSRQGTASSRAAQSRLGSEFIASPVYARDDRGNLRLIDVIQDRSRTPSRNQYGLRCHHFQGDGS